MGDEPAPLHGGEVKGKAKLLGEEEIDKMIAEALEEEAKDDPKEDQS